jgi:transposase InsO family protein
MFGAAIRGQALPKRVSTDHDPLFRFHRWLANLRVLEIEEIKSVPTVRREYLDRMFFWNALDLTRKLGEFRDYYNLHRVHRALDGAPPARCADRSTAPPAALAHHHWQQHCRGLFQIPIAD